MLPKLVNDMMKSNREIMGKLLADGGAYDSNGIFRCASDNGVYRSYIKVRKDARVRVKTGHTLRNLSVLSQRNDFGNWKDSAGYGKRWPAETVFSPSRGTV